MAVAAHQARGDDVVFEVDLELAFLGEDQFQEVQQVAGVQRRSVSGHRAGQVGRADNGHAIFDDHLVRHGQRAVAALGCCEVDDHRAWLHLRHGFRAQQRRCLAARNQRGGDDDVGLFGAFVYGCGLALHPAGRHRPRVTTNTDGAFTLFIGLVRHVDELGAEGFDLLFNRRTHVRRFDHCTQAFRRGNRLQPCNAGAENQHARRFHGARSRHQHRHEARIVVGGQQHGFIAGDVGLRGQHIQALGAGGTWRGFQRKCGNAALGQFGDGLIAERVEHAHHNGAALDQSQLAVAGSDHFQNQLGTKRIAGAANACTCRFISTVDNTGINAGAALNSDLMTLADQLLNGFRGCSNPCFTGLGFERNTNVHVKSPA
ncbi:hypothetical protein D3C81_637110 [compost metagenome]